MSELVIVPYTRLTDGVLDPLLADGVNVDLRYVGTDGEAYWRLLDELWRDGTRDLTVVEQDIKVRAGTLASFDDCPHGWCGAGYKYLGSGSYVGSGCVRFRAELIRAFPDLMDAVAKHDYPNHGPKHWCTLDAAIQRELWSRGRHVCANHGTVEHLGDAYPSHGCVPGYPGYRFG